MTMTRLAGFPGKGVESKRRRLDALDSQLTNNRQSFESHWRELAEHFRPRRTRFQVSDRNKGDKRSQKIIDSTGVFAATTLAAGMMSGITSPARQWFKLAVQDRDLMEHASVKWWLEDVRRKMVAVLNRSNFYEVLSTYYNDLGVFGTTALIVEEDDAKVIRCTHFAVGEYWIGYDSKQRVRVFMRKFELTVRQIVEQFGEKEGDGYSTKNLSDTVQSAWKAGTTEQGVPVVHFIYENPDYAEGRIEAKHKRFASCYYESGARSDVMLHEGGYDEWPVMAVRWEANTGDVYGTDCPGMTALADIKELQFGRKLGAGALHKAVNPPMVASANLKNSPVSILPGGITYIIGNDIGKQFAPAMDTSSFRLDWLTAWNEDIRQLVKRAFREDLFLMIANIDRGDVTATEVLEKKEEKLLLLGPVAKQVDGGFLDPFFDRLYGIMLRRGEIPEPPPELEGVEFHPEYESIMAQAQRAQGRSGVDAVMNFATALAAMDPNDPSALDALDKDEMLSEYVEMAGVPPRFLRDEKDVEATRQGRAEAQQKAEMAQQAETMSGAAKNLADSDMSGENALTQLVGAGPLNGAVGGL